MKVLVNGSPGVGETFFSAMHSLCHRVRCVSFSFFDSHLLPITAFDAPPPPPLLGFCFFAIFSASFRFPFSVVTSSARARNSAPLLDDDPQTWLLIWDQSVYLSNASFRSL